MAVADFCSSSAMPGFGRLQAKLLELLDFVSANDDCAQLAKGVLQAVCG